jgi:tRNA threonylcarbamoyladenosine biosynthesis protein TsaB
MTGLNNLGDSSSYVLDQIVNRQLTLSIETSTSVGSVSIVDSKQTDPLHIVFHQSWTRARSHAEALSPILEESIRTVGGWKSIGQIIVGIGPGSFTGIRVGLNAARAAAWSLKLPLIGVRSTDSLCESARLSGLIPSQTKIVALLPAQMGLVFAAWDEHEPVALSPVELEKRLAQEFVQDHRPVAHIGDGRFLVAEAFKPWHGAVKRWCMVQQPEVLDHPDSRTNASLGIQRLAVGLEAGLSSSSWQNVQPLYIRASGAEEQRR